MAHVEESTKQKRPRISWKNEALEKTFLEACIHEINTYGREGNSLKLKSWKNVGELLKKEYGFDAGQRQMKNRYDYIKGKYNVWSKLYNKTGNLYNAVTKSFNLTDEEWEIEMKCCKHADPLRSSPLLYPKLCIKLFDGVAYTRIDSWGPTSKSSHPEEQLEDPELNEDDDIQQPKNTSCPTQEPLVLTQECFSHSQPQSKKRKDQKSTHTVMAVADDISKIAKIMIEKTKGDDMSACIEKLEKHGWDTQDPMYQTALLLFGESSDLRKLWLVLKVESCESWIKNAGHDAYLMMPFEYYYTSTI